MARFNPSQKTVLLGIASAVVLGWSLFFGLRALLPVPATAREAVAWVALVPAVVFFVLVIAVGNARFTSEGIDPLQGRDPRVVVVTNRVLSNTTEQAFIFVLTGLSLIALLPVEQLGALPALAVLFGVARMAFWLGYLSQPLLRAPGMALTIQINLVMLLWCALAVAR
ncbi:MAPEG family protein [Archangium gephyra]|uniref:MAPEG family protein n=1 Tax=Archangium gephyra TaxID=48 RepID=UPI0035D4AE86